MIRSCNAKTVCTFVWFSAVLLLAVAAEGASPSLSSPSSDSELAYSHAKEITVVGTVERLVTHSASGGPPGFHLLITTSGNTVDAHLGPFLSRQNQEALVAGQLVQIVGITSRIHESDVLLARQLIFGGRLVTVRNERGALVREHPARRASARSTTGERKAAVNGGAQ